MENLQEIILDKLTIYIYIVQIRPTLLKETEMITKLFLSMIMGLVLLVTLSFGEKDIGVKPTTDSSAQATTAPQLGNEKSSAQRTATFEETEEEMLDLANSNHKLAIQFACGYYLTAYGTMPGSLDELLDGFMFIWPGDVYTGKPVKILDSMPNATSPDDIGGVYYERINYYTAKMHFLYKLPLASNSGGNEWAVGSFNIEPTTSGVTAQDGTWVEGDLITKMDKEDRFWFAFQSNLDHALPLLIYDSIARRNLVENNIVDLLKNSQYYIVDSGLQKMKVGLSEGRIKFDIGKVTNKNAYYYYVSDLHGNYAPICFDKLENSHISNSELCSELDLNKNSVFNSNEFDPDAFPVDVIITKLDVH
jgi:hypothetical protein